jgi:Putative nucleotidyltransferase DUF294
MLSEQLKRCTPARALAILERAANYSESLIQKAKEVADSFCQLRGLDTAGVCFIVVGSVGRKEALEASDFDFIPVASSDADLSAYQPHDGQLRAALAAALNVKVSKGEDLTKGISLHELAEADCIGGSKDSSGALTKRILILTESQKVSGGLAIEVVRRGILGAYAKEDRTSGRHVLSFCNDIARYYKTLCIEYKVKIDEEEKDWCTRNMKLRHSRKLWYFSNILSIAKEAEDHPLGSNGYVDALLQVLTEPPVERIVGALFELQPFEIGRLLESYAMFLEFMSKPENRKALATVEHDARYEMELGNPFPAMKFNSDVMHRNMIAILDGLSVSMRDRVINLL